MATCEVRRAGTGELVLARAHWCKSFWCHFRGLMLRRRLDADEGLLFVYGGPSVTQTTIHMFFMLFPITAIWLDGERRVVDAKLAKPWRPIYSPRAPAQYVIEARPEVLGRVAIGECLEFAEPV